MISKETLIQAREESETGNEQYSRGFVSSVITELLAARESLEQAKAGGYSSADEYLADVLPHVHNAIDKKFIEEATEQAKAEGCLPLSLLEAALLIDAFRLKVDITNDVETMLYAKLCRHADTLRPPPSSKTEGE